jgi:putative ABC transport system ATP-binding protein
MTVTTGNGHLNGQPLIELAGFGKRYRQVTAVSNVTLTVQRGDFIAITGPSGSGKTTLLGMMGLLEDATEGEYRYNGQPVHTLADSEASRLRNRSFGFVFQQFHLLPHLRAWENVARPLVYAGVPRAERRSRALSLLERLGLAARAQHYPAQLSGGEQQRVAIARALVNNPEVILADEPTGNLPKSQWEPILALLTQLNREGRTVIIVSHDPEVARCAQTQLVLCDGEIVGHRAGVKAP